MLETLKANAVPIGMLLAAIIGSHHLQEYRIDQIEAEMNKRETNILKQAELDKRVAVIETQYTFLVDAIQKNTEIGEELKDMVTELKK